jgi:hypothetical protein
VTERTKATEGREPTETPAAPSVKDEPAEDHGTANGARYAAKHAAEKILAPLLVSPATAVYPWEEIHSTQVPCRAPDRAWRVRGVVDAQNALGVPLRHKWQAFIFKRDAELFPIYLEMEGQVVFGSVAVLAEAGITPGDVEATPAPKQASQPQHSSAEVREWTDASGKFRVSARFAGLAFGKVKLEREDGQVIEIEVEKLSDEDREWIRSRR